MQVYEKIAWLQLNDDMFSLRRVFGKEKLKKIHQGLDLFVQESYAYGVERLTHENLEQFYRLYASYIGTKHNATVHDLLDRYSSRIDAGELLYFGYVKKGEHLLGGGIFVDKITRGKRGLMLAFRAFETPKFVGLSLGYYLEYLYFSFGLELGVDLFSRGLDRNCYGLFGSNVGLPIHKIQLHFFPYVSNKHMIDIDAGSIDQETVIFMQKDLASEKLNLVTIWTKLSPEDAEKEYGIFAKRGLSTNFIYL